MSGKPTTAFALVLAGGILVIINSILELVVGLIIRGVNPGEVVPFPAGMALVMVQFLKIILIVLGVIGTIVGLLMIIAATQINSGEPGKVRTWSVIGIILSVISILVAGGGFYVGFILGLVGGILGLTWKPAEAAPQPVAQAQTPPPV
ncbi:MAG: hypothetical protein QXF92_03870 [Thermosphaera sp.]